MHKFKITSLVYYYVLGILLSFHICTFLEYGYYRTISRSRDQKHTIQMYILETATSELGYFRKMILFQIKHGGRSHFFRGVVPGGAGGAMAPPDFGRSVNPISTRGDRLCPPNYYWHPRIFRPSDGPVI